METLEKILLWSLIGFGIVWLAVFICAFASQRRGTMPRFFSGGRSAHGLGPKVPRVWWRNIIMVPAACVLLPLFGLCWLFLVPPMFILEKWIFKPDDVA